MLLSACGHMTETDQLMCQVLYVGRVETLTFCLCSNLKKCEESVTRVQAELEENQTSVAQLTEQLKKLEDEAGGVMQACQEAEVGSSLFYFYSLPLVSHTFPFTLCVFSPRRPSLRCRSSIRGC